jgi:hypothetical protein
MTSSEVHMAFPSACFVLGGAAILAASAGSGSLRRQDSSMQLQIALET